MGKSHWILAAAVAAAGLTGTAAQAGTSIYLHVAPQPAYVWGTADYGYDRHYGSYRYRYGDRYRARDRDRDSIPDRFDHDLDNDGRPNRYDRDMDGDGVSNWRDRAPQNRYRY